MYLIHNYYSNIHILFNTFLQGVIYDILHIIFSIISYMF